MDRRTFIGMSIASASVLVCKPTASSAKESLQSKALFPTASQQKVQVALTRMDGYGLSLSEKTCALGYCHQAIRYDDELLDEAFWSAYEFPTGNTVRRAKTFNGIHQEITRWHGTEITSAHRLILSGQPHGFGGKTIRELITGTTADMLHAHRYLISCFQWENRILMKTLTAQS